MGVTLGNASVVTAGQAVPLMLAWSRGEAPVETAEEVHAAYECQKEFEEEEAYQAHLKDIADTYASIEAELWAGWREDCADAGMAA